MDEPWDASAPLETLSIEELKLLQTKLQVLRRRVVRRLDELQVPARRVLASSSLFVAALHLIVCLLNVLVTRNATDWIWRTRSRA